MLQAMRNKMHGWPSIILLGVCVFAMSLFGMESYFMSHDEAYVAKVGKHEIDQRAFQDRVNQVRQQLVAQQGDQFDSSSFEKPEAKLRILDGMVDEQLLQQANEDWGLRVPDLAVRDYIAAIPAFQVNGKFDGTSYQAWLTSQYKTPEMFEREIRSSLAIQLLPSAINASTIVSDARLDQFLKLQTQRRDLRYFVLQRPTLENSTVSDAEIEAYYKSHQADYMKPETVSVKYIEVVGADLPLVA
jgi:peptidyl-prolyl cis-trans isomerase D